MLAIDPRPGGATSHCAADNIALLDLVVPRLPGPLRRWAQEDPGLRVIVRDEPLHPRYHKRATEGEKQLGRRYQLIATNTKIGRSPG